MNFFELIENRHSIRKFADKDLPDEDLSRILQAANRAPSAGNLQAYQIYVVRDGALKRRLSEAAFNQEWIANAPVILVFCTNANASRTRYGMRGVELYTLQDATIACTYSQLAAAALGVGSTWVGAFDDNRVADLLNVEADIFPVAILPIGYPAETPYFTSRKELNEIVVFT